MNLTQFLRDEISRICAHFANHTVFPNDIPEDLPFTGTLDDPGDIAWTTSSVFADGMLEFYTGVFGKDGEVVRHEPVALSWKTGETVTVLFAGDPTDKSFFLSTRPSRHDPWELEQGPRCWWEFREFFEYPKTLAKVERFPLAVDYIDGLIAKTAPEIQSTLREIRGLDKELLPKYDFKKTVSMKLETVGFSEGVIEGILGFVDGLLTENPEDNPSAFKTTTRIVTSSIVTTLARSRRVD